MLSMSAAPSFSVNPERTQEITGEITEARSGLGTLVRAFASSLVLEPVSDPEPAPVVYTAAIHTSADLVSSLIGITELSRDQGFIRHPETTYGDGGRNATYHVDHSSLPISLSVNCNPLRQTVAIAVSGLDSEETLRCFQALELALFGSC
jgi:hypothetical protein